MKILNEDARTSSTCVIRPTCLPGVEFIRYSKVLPSVRFVSPSYVLALLQNASGHFWYRTSAHACPSGAVVMLDPEEVFIAAHQSMNAFARITHLRIAPDLVCRPREEARGQASLRLVTAPENGPLLAAYLLRLEQQLHARETALGVQQTLTLLLEQLCPNVERMRTSSGLREPSAVARAREILHAQLEEEVSLDNLADEVGLTKAYLVRAFGRAVGLPPHEYQMHLRVARAQRLLAQRLPAGEVAHTVGFYDQSHLNRWFKKVIGVTPGQYAHAVI